MASTDKAPQEKDPEGEREAEAGASKTSEPIDFRVENLGPCRKKVSVKVPPSRIREEYDRQYEEINERFVLPGFRKGRAPRRLLEKRFASQLGDDVKESLVKSALAKLYEEKRVEPLAPPDVKVAELAVDPSKDFEFDFELVTKPDFETPTWKGLEVKVPHPVVADEDVDRQVDNLRRSHATLEPAPDGTVQDEDILVVDWVAKSGDSVEARDDGAMYRLGRGVLGDFVVPELDEKLRGAKAGATASTKVNVPVDDPREELRGKDLDLEVTLKEVRRYVLPPVDEKLLKAFDYDDEKEMRDDVRKRILRAKQREVERLAEERLVESLLRKVEISLPPEFVEHHLESWAARRRIFAQMEGVSEDEIAKQVEAGRDDAKNEIERDLRRSFLLDRIAEQAEVKVTEEDVAGAIEEIARAYQRPPEEVAHSYRDPSRRAELFSGIRHRKAREAIRREATLVEEAPEASPAETAAEGEAAEGKHAKARSAKDKPAKDKPAKDKPAKDKPGRKK